MLGKSAKIWEKWRLKSKKKSGKNYEKMAGKIMKTFWEKSGGKMAGKL